MATSLAPDAGTPIIVVEGLSRNASVSAASEMPMREKQRGTTRQGVRKMRSLRILCLHGYRGNADRLRNQLRAIYSVKESPARFECVNAPSLSQGDFGWWHAMPEAPTPGAELTARPMSYKGWPRTQACLASIFKNKGPFDGVLGFSQGACLTSLLVGMRGLANPDGAEIAFDFAIMIGGLVSSDRQHAELYERRQSYDLPSLHVMGGNDVVVPPTRSRQLADRFVRPTIFQHDGGHVIPRHRSFSEAFARFLKERQ